MEDSSLPLIPPIGSPVTTACKGFLLLEQDTPQTVYRGRRFYFCLPDCLNNFLQNPMTSCMAGDPWLESE